MALLTKATVSTPGEIRTVVPAAPGWRVMVAAPAGTDVTGVPYASTVVAWAQIADAKAAGGSRLEPVFLADGRAWTPDQFRAAYGAVLEVSVTAG